MKKESHLLFLLKTGNGGSSNSRKPALSLRDSNRRLRRDMDMSKIECYNCHRFGYYAQDWREKRNAPWSRYKNNHGFNNNIFNNRRRGTDQR